MADDIHFRILYVKNVFHVLASRCQARDLWLLRPAHRFAWRHGCLRSLFIYHGHP